MKSGTSHIGLFQGMFEKNTLTYNPGWDSEAKELPEYADARRIQARLKEQSIKLDQEADPTTTGPRV